MSIVTKDVIDPNIQVELTDDTDFKGVNDFRDFPIMLAVNPGTLVLYMRKQEADNLAQQLNQRLLELDRRELRNL